MTDSRSTTSSKPLAALLTPRGRGAIATICFQGDCRMIDAPGRRLFCAANGKALGEQDIGRVLFGKWGDTVKEDIVVCRTDGHTVEMHCHGGDAAAVRILSDLDSIGCTICSWQEMTAFADGFFQQECNEALTRATTLRTAAILLEQHTGVLKSAIEKLYPSTGEQVDSELVSQIERRISELLKWSHFGCHLWNPWDVVLSGRPNVGKSSLINALVGYSRSIVFDQPGTTRDVVTAETALDGWPIRLADTAGIRAKADPLESAGIERAQKSLAAADCRVLLFDISREPHADDWQLLADWPDALPVAHKCDLPDIWGDAVPDGALYVSSKTGEGVDQLVKCITSQLVPEVPSTGTPVPISERQVNLLRHAKVHISRGDESAFREAIAVLLD